MDDLGESWTENALKDLGFTVSKNQIKDLPLIVNELISTKTSEEIINFRTKNVYNYGHSGEIIADYLIEEGRKIKLQNSPAVQSN